MASLSVSHDLVVLDLVPFAGCDCWQSASFLAQTALRCDNGPEAWPCISAGRFGLQFTKWQMADGKNQVHAAPVLRHRVRPRFSFASPFLGFQLGRPSDPLLHGWRKEYCLPQLLSYH